MKKTKRISKRNNRKSKKNKKGGNSDHFDEFKNIIEQYFIFVYQKDCDGSDDLEGSELIDEINKYFNSNHICYQKYPDDILSNSSLLDLEESIKELDDDENLGTLLSEYLYAEQLGFSMQGDKYEDYIVSEINPKIVELYQIEDSYIRREEIQRKKDALLTDEEREQKRLKIIKMNKIFGLK
jgi:hypothetical protein